MVIASRSLPNIVLVEVLDIEQCEERKLDRTSRSCWQSSGHQSTATINSKGDLEISKKEKEHSFFYMGIRSCALTNEKADDLSRKGQPSYLLDMDPSLALEICSSSNGKLDKM